MRAGFRHGSCIWPCRLDCHGQAGILSCPKCACTRQPMRPQELQQVLVFRCQQLAHQQRGDKGLTFSSTCGVQEMMHCPGQPSRYQQVPQAVACPSKSLRVHVANHNLKSRTCTEGPGLALHAAEPHWQEAPRAAESPAAVGQTMQGGAVAGALQLEGARGSRLPWPEVGGWQGGLGLSEGAWPRSGPRG